MNNLDVDSIKCVEDIFKEFETFKENRHILATGLLKLGPNNFDLDLKIIYQIDTDNMRYMYKPISGDDLSYKWSDSLQTISDFVVKSDLSFKNPYLDYFILEKE